MIQILASRSHRALAVPKIRLLPGGNKRERVLSPEEEEAYLSVAQPLLKDVATCLFDTALRPEELFRLSKKNYVDGMIVIHFGKGKGSRRNVPASDRVKEILARRAKLDGPWFFPADSKEGHIGHSSIKKQHRRALKDAMAKKDSPLTSGFVVYSMRHTRLTPSDIIGYIPEAASESPARVPAKR